MRRGGHLVARFSLCFRLPSNLKIERDVGIALQQFNTSDQTVRFVPPVDELVDVARLLQRPVKISCGSHQRSQVFEQPEIIFATVRLVEIRH